MMSVLPYFMPLTIPILALSGVFLGGYWVLAGFLFSYIIHPLLDTLVGEDSSVQISSPTSVSNRG